jgi:hypothetical protein
MHTFLHSSFFFKFRINDLYVYNARETCTGTKNRYCHKGVKKLSIRDISLRSINVLSLIRFYFYSFNIFELMCLQLHNIKFLTGHRKMYTNT